MLRNACRALNGFLLSTLLVSASIFGQTSAPSLSGQVLDSSGAAIPGLDVITAGPSGTRTVAQTGEQGKYAFHSLAPGVYTVTIRLKGFNDFVKPGIVIARGQPQVVSAQLSVALEKQQITVTSETTKISVNPSENASALVIKGKDLEALSDDPDELQSELEALAGPSAGPSGGQIYIDGFTGGQIPPKSSIREIRVNQNPFSAQYDMLGYGRIEILTKPGTDKFHGQVSVSGNDSAFNTRNPFAAQIPSYHSEMYEGNFGGPISKKTSFFIDAQRRNIEDQAVVNAIVLDQNLNQTALVETFSTPQTRTHISPRIDTQIGNNDTLTSRYQFWENNRNSSNVGQFTLPSAALNMHQRHQSFQASDAHVINEKAVTEIRFRYEHEFEHQTPASPALAVNVLGAFIGGGSSQGVLNSTTNSYEIQNYTSVSFNKHFLKFGIRVRDNDQSSSSTAYFNGAYTFPSIDAYKTTEQGLQAGLTGAQIRASGGGVSQFIVVTGNPLTSVNYFDIEPYFEDDWKVRPNLTISSGMRFETQNHIHGRADFAPRVGIAWGLGNSKSVNTVLRAGFGVFFDRFQEDYIINSVRLNGFNQQLYILPSPDFFPNIPPPSILAASSITPTIYQIDSNIHSPYNTQAGIGLERKISRSATVAVTYLNTHGVHQFVSRNINAPDPANPGHARPVPGISDLYQYEAGGLYNQNQIIANFNVRASRVSLFGFYTLNFVDSNTASAVNFPMNQYNLAEDYGRAISDVRHRFFLGGTWNLSRGFQIFPFVVASSAPPFNIIVGPDLNGDSIFNDRPAFASSLSHSSNLVTTTWGRFDTVPVPGETIIPSNYGGGFGQFTTNLRLSKTFGFGKAGQGGGSGGSGGGGHRHGSGLGPAGLSSMGGGNPFNQGNATNHRYNLTISVSARNLFNSVNYAPPVGNLSSPLFGQPIALAGGFFSSNAANRRIDLQGRFSF